MIIVVVVVFRTVPKVIEAQSVKEAEASITVTEVVAPKELCLVHVPHMGWEYNNKNSGIPFYIIKVLSSLQAMALLVDTS